MTDVTRAYYINQILTVRSYPSGRTPAVNTTDINRAAGTGTGGVPANVMTVSTPGSLPSAAQNEIDGNVDPTKAPVIGTDIRDLVQSKATTWSNVRILRYQLDGDISPAGSQYLKYAYITGIQPGYPLSSSVPGTGNALFDTLDAGEDIDVGDFNVILATLKVVVNSDADDEYPWVIHYCHSQCHSQCHGSRGRR